MCCGIQSEKSGRIDSVAFSAIVNKALIAKENETIPFGYVTLNEGNAYNATSGIFTCPKPGLYLFSFHILSFNSEKPEGSSSAVWLTVNGVPVVLTQETVSAGGNKDFNLHGSIVARLNVTDKVYVASVIDGTVVYYRKKSAPNDSVAFSAVANKLMLAKENQTILFGNVQLNEGGAYNATSGVFVCPKSGLYLFSFHILSFNSEQPEGSSSAVWLAVNGIPFVVSQQTVPADGSKDYNLHGSTVIRLNVDDKVLIASVIDGTNVYLLNSYFNGVQQNTSSNSVAFSAVADTIITAKKNETIVFGYVQLNEGNGYNSSSGVFVCPRSGLYQFSYHIFTFYSYQYGGDAAGVWLSINGTPSVMTQETAPAKDVNYNVHGSTVVRLDKGDQVLIGSGINATLVFFMSSYFNGVRVAD
ncbi:hypothetical protein KUTeg_014737 [Tegillarca granosa]|uniref:C1q domain-containing protein n=1 Tax=Tegillarca granosa TaxID=220873 RepID=A0ABQ9ETP1_TEGGR|nr:hypothetical protein KUTeg_014737 [Tegillarca granosa]